MDWVWVGWDLCVGLLYEHRFAMLITEMGINSMKTCFFLSRLSILLFQLSFVFSQRLFSVDRCICQIPDKEVGRICGRNNPTSADNFFCGGTSEMFCPNWTFYLSKFKIIFVQIQNYICPISKLFLSKLNILFFKIQNYICPNFY